jgi:hypothetical protein
MGILNQKYIKKVLEKADTCDWVEGSGAYFAYHETMTHFAEYYKAPLRGTIAAFVALSPNNDYMGNLRSLATVLLARQQGVPLQDVTVSTYNACRNRAWEYLSGERDFLRFTKGPKTRAFYLNILEPWLAGPITIDGHMKSLWFGKRLTMKEAVREVKARYDDIAHDFRVVAKNNHLMPHQLQAILWFTWKRIHNVLAVQQFDLFRGGDQWGVARDPIAVKPYPFRMLETGGIK